MVDDIIDLIRRHQRALSAIVPWLTAALLLRLILRPLLLACLLTCPSLQALRG